MTAFRIGFRGFRRPETITQDRLQGAIESTNLSGQYVWYTGGQYGRRRASLRSNSLATITEVKKPVPVKTLLERAAKAHGQDVGYDPKTVLSGLKLHQGAKPCVYLMLEADAEGNLVAYQDIPDPDGFARPFKRGDIVIKVPAEVKKARAEAAKAAAEAAKKAKAEAKATKATKAEGKATKALPAPKPDAAQAGQDAVEKALS